MKTIQERKEIVGTLVTQGQRFDLLELYPDTKANIPFWFKDSVFQFLVVDGLGFAQPLIVSRGGFYILPHLETKTKIVQFMVEEEQTENKNAPVLEFVEKIQS